MGLTFGYEFRLPATMSRDEVGDVLSALKRHAVRSKFRSLSPTFEGVTHVPSDGWRHVFNVFAIVNSDPPEEERQYFADANTVLGFLASPGRGAEVASFAFMRRTFKEDGSREWFWQGWCKTQYASNHGEKHFVECHLRLVDMMEFAIRSGIDVTVFDEGAYWETRDVNVLLAELDKMNRLVARVAGQLHDATRKVESPIFERRDFERLEG